MLANIIRFASNIVVAMLAILLSFAVLDGIWLGVIAGDWYRAEMQSLLREQVITWPWAVFYLLYGGVIFVLAVVANRDKPLYYAGIDGALLGLAAYGTYNLTNYSLIDGFSLTLALVDWCWGIVVTGLCAMAGWAGFRLKRGG
ncbi:DUF2177 family protein [Alteromonas antoniana]|uniref:DUF2177 family protein n=1 Tax=Alteromonas antoniana TaxID=2803813 RepID=UPI001C49762B|nr:DUF2177 family protein [Alteromonas antoniana]